MTARKLPPLNALRAFEAAARHQSFTLAAQELSVTQGAVSHQVRSLEEALGITLFERLPNQLRLTAAGNRYAVLVGNAFDRIESGARNLHQVDADRYLSMSTSPNFSARWLIPRLGALRQRHPDLVLRLEQSAHHINFIRDGFDIAIRYGEGPWPGSRCTRLGDEFLVPVCAPSLGSVRTANDIARMPLLHVNDHQAWADWLVAQGYRLCLPGMVFNHESAAIDAAIAGQGVALARSSLVTHAVRHGTLIAPVPLTVAQTQAYWLVCPTDVLDAGSMALRDWLLQSFETDRQMWTAWRSHHA